MSERRYDFFREGCSKLGENVSEAFRLAGWTITASGVADVVDTLPWNMEDIGSEEWKRGACNRLLKAAHDGCGAGERARHDAIAAYFLAYIPSRPYESLDMLQGAFCGVLGGIRWPEGRDVASTSAGPAIPGPSPDLPREPAGVWECPSCLAALNLPQDAAGRSIKYPSCGHKMAVPPAASPD